MTMARSPSNIDEWTTHVLNIQGAIFERWVANIIRNSRFFLDATEFPVEFPPPHGAERGFESTLDVRAHAPTPHGVVTLLIECKKNNPKFVDWVFFEANRKEPPMPRMWVNHIATNTEAGEAQPSPKLGFRDFDAQAPVTDHATETRGRYDDQNVREFTKTGAQAISEACHQVAIATQAIINEEISLALTGRAEDLNWEPKTKREGFFPTIVTTARLKVLGFDPAKVDPTTGELPYDDASIRTVDWLYYLYPVPRHLQFAARDTLAMIEAGERYKLMKLPIVIVTSGYFENYLEHLLYDSRRYA
jgi:hypothetical protein